MALYTAWLSGAGDATEYNAVARNRGVGADVFEIQFFLKHGEWVEKQHVIFWQQRTQR